MRKRGQGRQNDVFFKWLGGPYGVYDLIQHTTTNAEAILRSFYVEG